MSDWLTAGATAGMAGTGVINSIIGGIQGIKNLKFQKDVFTYQKELQNKMFRREDNAVQRKARDLELAGLSKTLAAGGGAQAGPVVKVDAPQADFSKMSQGISQIAEAPVLAMEMMKMKQDVARTKAQNELIKAQAEKTKAETDFMSKMNPLKITEKEVDLMFKEQLTQEKLNNLIWKNESAIKNLDIIDLNKQLKELGVEKSELDIVAQQVKNKILDKNLSLKDQEKLIKALTIEIKTNIRNMQQHDYKIITREGTTSSNQGGVFGAFHNWFMSGLEDIKGGN